MYSPQGLSKRFSPELIDGRNSTTDYGRNTIPVNIAVCLFCTRSTRKVCICSVLPVIQHNQDFPKVISAALSRETEYRYLFQRVMTSHGGDVNDHYDD